MSERDNPFPWYFFATETTNLRFASTNSFIAALSPFSIRTASSTSLSGGKGSY